MFAEIEKGKGRDPLYVAGHLDGKLCFAGIFSLRPLVFGRWFSLEAVCLRGPVFDNVEAARECLRKLSSLLHSRGVGSIRLSPYWTFPDAAVVEEMLKEEEFVPCRGANRLKTGFVCLENDLSSLYGSISGNTRRKIKQGEKLGISIRPASGDAEIDQFYTALDRFNIERGVFRMSRGEFYSFYNSVLVHQNLGTLLGAFSDGLLFAGVIAIRSPFTAQCPNIFVNRRDLVGKYNSWTATPSVFWAMLQWAKRKGCKAFDMEGYVANTNSTDPFHAIYEAKAKFLPDEREILSEHKLVCNATLSKLDQASDLTHRIYKRIRRLQFSGGH